MQEHLMTDDEAELYTIINGLEAQANQDEMDANRAERNEKIFTILGGLSTAAFFFAEGNHPVEKGSAAGVAVVSIVSAFIEHSRWPRLFDRAEKRRELANKLRDEAYEI